MGTEWPWVYCLLTLRTAWLTAVAQYPKGGSYTVSLAQEKTRIQNSKCSFY